MHKRDLKSLYSWAQSVASSSGQKRPSKRAKDDSSLPKQVEEEAPLEPAKVDNPPASTEEQLEEDWTIPSDTIVALKMMCAQFPKIDKVAVRPFVLRSQLYSSVKDRTTVDRELEVLKQQLLVRLFKLSTGQDDYGIMFVEDYLSQVKAAKKRMETKHSQDDVVVFDWFMSHVLPCHLDVSITQVHLETLLSKGGCVQGKQISLLISAGLLVRQLADATSYWFSIPNVGLLLKSLTQGRKELLSFLSRRRYKEMLLSALEKRRLRTSQWDIRFHVRDLLGSGHLCTVHTASGLLIRVSRD